MNANEEEAERLMNEDVRMEQKKPEDDRYCPCCSDTICIGIAWGIFAICVIIFIIAIVFKLQKD